MTDHDATVAAVLAEAMYSAGMHPRFRLLGDEATHFANVGLAALTAAGYAVVKLPEGVAVEHGARLVDWGICEHGGPVLYAIEAADKGES